MNYTHGDVHAVVVEDEGSIYAGKLGVAHDGRCPERY